MNTKKPSSGVLLFTIFRRDGGELRLLGKKWRGHSYIEVAAFAPETEGGLCLRSIALRCSELRPLALALLEACKRDEENISERSLQE